MKRIIIVLLAMISIVLLVSCTKKIETCTVTEKDGVKIYHNKNIPSDPNFKITPKEVFTIQGYDENATDTLRNFVFSQCIKVDTKDNIFVMDKKKSEIKKFNKDGEFIMSFGRKGTGPGEMEQPNTMVMQNDTLYICDEPRRQLVIFDNDGNFIKKSLLDNSLMFMEPVDSTQFISIYGTWEKKDDEWYQVYNLHLRDFKFKVLNSLRESVFKYIRNETYFFDHMPSFCVGKENIYVAKISTNEYCIDVYDFKSNEKYRILKHFRRIPMSEEESESINKMWWCKHKTFKKAIDQISMYEDKNGYLLVKVPLERNESNRYDYTVDAFKDGVFINRFKMDIGKAIDSFDKIHKKYFYGDRIYDQNCDDNCVTVYEY